MEGGKDITKHTLPFHKKVSLETHAELMDGLGTLSALRQHKHHEIIAKKYEIDTAREHIGYVESGSYPLDRIRNKLKQCVLSLGYTIDHSDRIEVNFIDRKQFDGDITIKVSNLLSTLKAEYRSVFLPKLIEAIHADPDLSDIVSHAEIKNGKYLNMRCKDTFLLQTIDVVDKLGSLYGHHDTHAGDHVVIDYSSPNTAKSLHAGHIRSTVLGEILGNIYEANGYTVHRVNHINDWGGFGVYLAGSTYWGDILQDAGFVENDLMVEIYRLYRLAEKSAADKASYDTLSDQDSSLFSKLIGSSDSYETFTSNFDRFTSEAARLFQELESGNEDVVTQRHQIVEWSLSDFQSFYDAFDIHLDYVVGESFYADKGKQLVLEGVDKENIVYFDDQEVEQALKDLDLDNDLSEKIKARRKKEILNDEGSYVVKLPKHERYVVMKEDGTSIYATRDLGAVQYRIDTYDPTMMVYVVGQEQGEHFQKLFDSSKSLAYGPDVDMQHTPFGFYVHAETKKKLSSREGAANVHSLIDESKKYYLDKYKGNEDFSETEKQLIANNLAIGGIVFNDISKGRMQQVGIHPELQKTIQNFERKGGVYLIYTYCRAKSVLAKSNVQSRDEYNEISIGNNSLTWEEIDIIKKINSYPHVIQKAKEKHEPAIFAQFMYELAQSFNTFYNTNPILTGGDALPRRLWITKQVAQVLKNGCDICHIPTVERI